MDDLLNDKNSTRGPQPDIPVKSPNGVTEPGLFHVPKETIRAILRAVAIFCLVLLAVEAALFAFRQFSSNPDVAHSDLDIVAAVFANSNGLSVVGRVLYDGEPVTNARVWCIGRDEVGNRFSPTNASSTTGSHFRLDGLPAALALQDSIVKVYARSSLPALLGATALRGEVTIMTKGDGRQVNIMDSKLWPCTLAFFCVSILIGLAIQVVDLQWRRQLYIASVMTALALTAGMLLAIAEAYMRVKASVTAGQTWSVGFISIFQGTYVKDTPEQWLISLTGPPHDKTTPITAATSPTANPIQGLGAPMWVVFLAVIGAALSTVALIVKEIRSPPKFFDADPAELRERMLILVQNQFFMLFAPLGSIFVYQGLILAGAAAQPFVVAIAAMGAGATLNIVLSLAVSKASEALSKASQNPNPPPSSASVVSNPAQPSSPARFPNPLKPATEKDPPVGI